LFSRLALRDVAERSAKFSLNTPSDNSPENNRAGLCADCLHARRVESTRGSVFFLCELSLTDSRFPKYPRLPVLSCSGYQPKPESTV
jgi:hypothetical protein